ncbi:unnamed protein product [Callosobruchus maculatus]|nr:unnamed protein product [Callosobruchus maculatus]
MDQQGKYIIEKSRIDANYVLQGVKLKHCELFKTLKSDLRRQFNLLSLSDLQPDALLSHLNFFDNYDMVCESCLNNMHKKEVISRPSQKKRLEIEKQRKQPLISDTSDEIFYGIRFPKPKEPNPSKIKVVPRCIEFRDYEVDKKYKTTVRIINTSHTLQSIIISQFPKFKCFQVDLKLNSKLAAGMSVIATIKYSPTVYRNITDKVVFKNSNGEEEAVTITTFRESAQLTMFVFKNDQYVDFPSSFSFCEKRRAALNYTIDCGSCLVSQFVLASLLIQNNCSDAKFFIITEDEWLFQDIEHLTDDLELCVGPFWIYPTHFQIRKNGIVEINLLYQPTTPGVHLERLFIICDNNSVQGVEIIGDSYEFSPSILKVNVDNDIDIGRKDHYCIFLGHVEETARKTLQFTILNKSNVILQLGWKFRNKEQNNVKDIKRNWIVADEKDEDWHLLPYGSTDFEFDIVLDAEEAGYHSIFFDIFVLDVPLNSLVEDVEMIAFERSGPVRRTFAQCEDILVSETEIACYVDIEQEIVENSCACDLCEDPWHPSLSIVPQFLNFGILPTGLNVEKEFYVQNLRNEQVAWKIFEIRYNIDRVPYSEVLRQVNCEFNCGQFTKMWQNAKIMYRIVDKFPGNWVSILTLASLKNGRIDTIEGVCIVTYEIIDYDIVITAGNPSNPILCPLKLMYVDIPIEMKFTIENRSPITGCFCLAKPYGLDSHKISLKLTPQSAILKPYEIVEVTAVLQSSEVGIFENTFVPCFFSLGQSPIVIRVLCAVDTLHVFFYLPEFENNFRKVIWPPKIVYEYDWRLGCPCEMENCLEHASENLSVSTTVTDILNYSIHLDPPEEQLEHEDVNLSTETSVTEVSETGSIVAVLKEQFGDDFLLQSNKVEVKVAISKPTNVVIYIQNVTPVNTEFVIDVQNFPVKKDYNPSWLTLKLDKSKHIWDSLIDKDNGILVQPDIEHGELKGFGWTKVNLWIYANTWGIYSEDVIIDLLDTPSFCFSLLIDVTGIPVEFPMALNAITKYPTVRFGYLPYGFSNVSRNIAMVNTSCIPIHIIWHVFLSTEKDDSDETNYKFNLFCDVIDGTIDKKQCKLILTKRGYGVETTEFLKIIPEEMDVEAHSSTIIKLEMNSRYFGNQTKPMDVTCFVLGSIHLKEEYRKKPNYYYRKIGSGESIVRFQVLAHLELPLLSTDLRKDDACIYMYANEVIFEQKYFYWCDVIFRNQNLSICDIHITIDEPFYLPDSHNTTKKDRIRKCTVCPLDVLKVRVMCYVDHQQILNLSKSVYPEVSGKEEHENKDDNDILCKVEDDFSIVSTSRIK